MQTVVNNYIINSTVVGSTILQGLHDCADFTVSNGMPGGGLAAEALRIFCGLDMRRQVKALAFLYELEDAEIKNL